MAGQDLSKTKYMWVEKANEYPELSTSQWKTLKVLTQVRIQPCGTEQKLPKFVKILLISDKSSLVPNKMPMINSQKDVISVLYQIS